MFGGTTGEFYFIPHLLLISQYTLDFEAQFMVVVVNIRVESGQDKTVSLRHICL